MTVAKRRTIEKWKLKYDWTKLLTEQMHGLKEFLKVGFAVHEDFFMRDDLWYFDRENKPLRCSGSPVAHSLREGHA